MPNSIIIFIYSIFTLFMLVIVSLTSITFFQIFPAILFMWVLALLFLLGFSNRRKEEINIDRKSFILLNLPKFILVFNMIFSLFASYTVVRFYTGQSFSDVLNSIINQKSLYYEYQIHFKENQVGIFSLKKLPYIILNMYLKFNLLYGYFSIFGYFTKGKKIELFYKVYICMITFSYLYFGLSRGTNFEMFEYLVLIIVIFYGRIKKVNIRRTIFILGMLISASIFFFKVIEIRGGAGSITYYISQDISIDRESLLLLLFPNFSLLIISLFSYFGFGLYYLGIYIDKVWFSTGKTIAGLLLPSGTIFFQNTSARETMRNIIDVGARWHPDGALFVSSFGFIILLLCCYFLGYIAKVFSVKRDPLSMMVIYFVILQMLSFPVGNFVFASSSSILCIILIILCKIAHRILGNSTQKGYDSK